MHEGTEREPETIKHREVVREGRSVGRVVDVPLVGTEPGDEEEDEADSQIGDDDTDPDLVGEWLHEGEDSRLLLLRLLDHDADAEVHERLREVDHTLAHRRDRQRGHCQIGLLW